MPLIDTTGRLSTDRCAIQLRDSDNRQLYDFSVMDRHAFTSNAAHATTCPSHTSSVCDTGARAAIDAYLRGNDCKSDESDDDTAFLLVPPSMLKVPDPEDCGCIDTGSQEDKCSSPRQQRDGYGLGACAQNIGNLHNERGRRTQPRTFVATPNYGAAANIHRAPLSLPDVRRGSRIIMTSEDTKYGPQPSKPPNEWCTKKTFCDTYLRVRGVDDDQDVYGCCPEPSGRIVDRLAEREWDVFDPIIRERSNSEVNTLRPCEWVPGGAASRDIARTPEFRRLVNKKTY